MIVPLPILNRRKIFISYHHGEDQIYADTFRSFYGETHAIIDKSLKEPFISNDNDYILSQIRTKYLKDSTVTIVLIGSKTWSRKWVDWEIYSSLRPYSGRTVNGLLGILLPSATKLPPRFAANFKVRVNPLNKLLIQNGYARLIMWSWIAPPFGWNLPLLPGVTLNRTSISEETMRKRSVLSFWVEQAYKNRSFPNMIDNTLPRFINNKPII